jgi:hypothetical protein
MMCPQFIMNLGTISLPLVARNGDSCGSVIYTAKVDRRPVDGALQQITVTDNTRNRCPHVVAQNPTDIVLSQIPGRASFNEERVSTFSATQLRAFMVQ